MRKSVLLPVLAVAIVPLACFCVLAQQRGSAANRGEGNRGEGDPMLAVVNKNAGLLKNGDGAAPTILVHQLFINTGIPTELADTGGLTSRITRADNSYRNGSQSGVRETDVVKAVNNLSSTLGVPEWARTDLTEVRRLRMHMLANYPQLMASKAAPDSSGKFRALDEYMSPIEGSYLALTLLYQKRYNAEYQLTAAEHVAYLRTRSTQALGPSSRTAVMAQALEHVDAASLISMGHHFFDDLGLRQ